MEAVFFRWSPECLTVPQPFHLRIMTGWCGLELKKKRKRKGYFP